MYTKIAQISLAGLQHHEYKNNVAGFERIAMDGAYLNLAAEPENPYDKYAVRVEFSETLHGTPRKMGYLARGVLQEVMSKLLSAKYTLKATIAIPDVLSPKLDIYIETRS